MTKTFTREVPVKIKTRETGGRANEFCSTRCQGRHFGTRCLYFNSKLKIKGNAFLRCSACRKVAP